MPRPRLIRPTVNNLGQTHYFCRGCQQTKPVSEFGTHRERKEGHMSRCLLCHARASKAWKDAHPAQFKARAHAWRGKSVEERTALKAQRKARRKTRGHTHATYLAKLAEQGGGCAICHLPPTPHGRRFALDHDHATGQDRGLLCGACNRGLGLFKDSPVRITAAAWYLDRWKRLRLVQK